MLAQRAGGLRPRQVEAKSSNGERNAVAHLKLFFPFPSAQQLRMGSFLGRPLRYFVSRREWADGSSGRGGTRVQACRKDFRREKGSAG